jgi:hypothetical protein
MTDGDDPQEVSSAVRNSMRWKLFLWSWGLLNVLATGLCVIGVLGHGWYNTLMPEILGSTVISWVALWSAAKGYILKT